MGFIFVPPRLGWALYLLCPGSFCPLLSLSLSRCGDTSAAAARVPSGAEAEAYNRRGREGLIRRWRQLAPPGTWEAQVLIPKQILDEWNALLGSHPWDWSSSQGKK